MILSQGSVLFTQYCLGHIDGLVQDSIAKGILQYLYIIWDRDHIYGLYPIWYTDTHIDARFGTTEQNPAS